MNDVVIFTLFDVMVLYLLSICYFWGSNQVFSEWFWRFGHISLKPDYSEAAVRRCCSKQVYLKISHYSKKKYVLKSLSDKVVGLKVCNYIKNRLQHRCFPVNFGKFLRTSVFIEHFRWLLLTTVLNITDQKIWWRFVTSLIACSRIRSLFVCTAKNKGYANITSSWKSYITFFQVKK